MKTQTKLGMLLLLMAGGCGQILGLSDYEVDPALGDAGEGGQAQGEGGGDTSGGSGKTGDAGAGNVGQGGEPEGGMPGVGGSGVGGVGGSPEVPVVVIPCDSVECCTAAGGIVDERELLQNVGFEEGQVWWDEASVAGFDIIVHEDDAGTINAHLAEWFSWFGGAINESATLTSPPIDVPADTGWVTLSGYRYLVYDSLTSTTDWAAISLFQGEDLYEDIFFWDNFAYDTSVWTAFEVSGAGEFYAGLSFELIVLATTDATSDDMTPNGQLASNFFFDDISFTSSRCIEPPQ